MREVAEERPARRVDLLAEQADGVCELDQLVEQAAGLRDAAGDEGGDEPEGVDQQLSSTQPDEPFTEDEAGNANRVTTTTKGER